MSSLAASDAGPELTGSGCPPPLSWREVTAAFREQRRIHQCVQQGQELTVSCFGDGPPLYVLGGLLGDEQLFALLAWLLKEEHTCVVVPWTQITVRSRQSAEQILADVAATLLSVADDLGHDQFALHASTFGGLVALEAMITAPERVRWATLQGAFAARRFSWAERALMWRARQSSRQLGDSPWAMSVQKQNHQRWFPPIDPTRWEFYEEQAGDTPICRVAQAAAIAAGVDLRPRLSQIAVPVSLIQAEGDGRVSTAAQAELAKGLPNCATHLLNHCGSLPHVTHPHRLAKIIRESREAHSRC